MLDFRVFSKGAYVSTAQAFVRIFLLLAFAASCLCITKAHSYPPTLSAPVTISSKLVAKKVDGLYVPAIALSWAPPSDTANAVSTYSIERAILDTAPLNFQIVQSAIPDTTLHFEDPLSAREYPLRGAKKVLYRVFAFDTLGRPSDTSRIDTFYMALPAQWDTQADTLQSDTISWKMFGLSIPYRSCFFVWNDSGLSFQGAWSEFKYAGEFETVLFFGILPDSVIVKKPARLFLGAWIKTYSGDYRESLVIRAVHVRS